MKKLILGFMLLASSLFATSNALAAELHSGPMVGFMISPMNERITLSPGETYTNFFYVMNPEENTIPVSYSLKVQGFYRNDDGGAIFEDVDGRSQIVNWITLNSPTESTIAPSVADKVYFTIQVPENPPAGGQYAAITVTSAPVSDNPIIEESVAMNYTIFTEVKGETIMKGDIRDLNVPFFLSDGNITASSSVKNIGNTHGVATFTMKITPLFSSEPVFSNEQNPDKKLVLPDRTVSQETTWEDTPGVGIFNVHYKVEYEGGETEEINKLVIKCPFWLIAVSLIGLSGFIYAAVRFFKSKKKAQVSQG